MELGQLNGKTSQGSIVIACVLSGVVFESRAVVWDGLTVATHAPSRKGTEPLSETFGKGSICLTCDVTAGRGKGSVETVD